MRNRFQPKPVKPTAQVNMPSKHDRLLLFRRLERAAEERIQSIGRLPDTTRRSILFGSTSEPPPDLLKIGVRRRQVEYFGREFLPMVSAALLLELEDLHDQKDAELSSDAEVVEQPIECITLLISNMVLLSQGNYDARARSIVKGICVELLANMKEESPPTNADDNEEEEDDPPLHVSSSLSESNVQHQHPPSRTLYFLQAADQDDAPDGDGVEQAEVKRTTCIPKLSQEKEATMRLESIERAIATDILREMVERAAEEKRAAEEERAEKKRQAAAARRNGSQVKNMVIRGLQIGTVSVVVGSLFAFTGGLAAPGLVAAITALHLAGTGVAFATLTTTTALSSLFGVVGGGLAAYKMKKRTAGLSEWRIRNETQNVSKSSSQKDVESVTIRGLHASVCVSGWLADKSDFQKPWGIQPNDPKIADKLELLQRFFVVHGPEKIKFAKALLKTNRKDAQDLWIGLAQAYGRDPDHLLPFDASGEDRILSVETEATIDGLLKSQVLEKERAKRMEEIYDINTMLIKMESMNTQMFATMDNAEVLEALKDTSASLPSSPCSAKTSEVEDEEGSKLLATEPSDAAEVVETAPVKEAIDSIASAEEDGASAKNDFAEQDTVEKNEQDLLAMMEAANAEVLAQSPQSAKKVGHAEVVQAEEMSAEDLLSKMEAANNEVLSASNSPLAASNGRTKGESSLTSQWLGTELTTQVNNFGCSSEETLDEGTEAESKAAGEDESTLAIDECCREEEKKNESGDFTGQRPSEEVLRGENDMMKEESDHSKSSTDSAANNDHSLVVWDWQATYGGELYTVTWETDLLLKLCKVVSVLFLEISNQVSKVLLQQTLIGGLVSAVAIPSALVTCAGVIDDPYQVISLRSEKAGVELAHCLLQSDEHRPISLVGFSFGARVVFSCLLELARHQTLWEEKQKPPEKDEHDDKTRWRSKKKIDPADDIDYNREPGSIVEDAIMIGMPRLVDIREWVNAREIASGRVVNCYNKNDWIVSYMINVRCWSGIRSTCGTHPVENIEGVENFEVSEFASSHGQYQVAMPQILQEVGYGLPRKMSTETIEEK